MSKLVHFLHLPQHHRLMVMLIGLASMAITVPLALGVLSAVADRIYTESSPPPEGAALEECPDSIK